jgi:hypothetical protein
MFADHPVLIIFLTAALASVGTIVSRLLYDRYLAPSTRVTRREFTQEINRMEEECELKRIPCIQAQANNKAYFEGLINQQRGCLDDVLEDEATSQQRRTIVGQALACIMLTQLEICSALKKSIAPELDCSSILKKMGEMGVIT